MKKVYLCSMLLVKFRHILLISLMILFCGCAYQKEYNAVSKRGTPAEKYDFAVRAYDKGDYKKAITVMEELMPSYRGKDNFESLIYHLAYAYFYERDYYMAAYYFRMVGRMFPSSAVIEETAYMSAYCKFLESPYYKLDQSATTEAIKQLQLFINYYPNSPKVDEAARLITEMRHKLALKAYEVANMYYRRSLYNAAAIAYYNFLRDYPESVYREEAAFKMLRSRFLYAENSIKEKQNERYAKVGDAYEMFLRSFADSKYRKEADRYYSISQSKINKR